MRQAKAQVARLFNMCVVNVQPKSVSPRAMQFDAACAATESFTKSEPRGMSSGSKIDANHTELSAEWSRSNVDSLPVVPIRLAGEVEEAFMG